MNYSEYQLALLSAQQQNILAITSVCNMKCIFCSHQGNPSSVETFADGHRPLEEIEEIIQFLDPTTKIVIGESVTRICEGEPFVHPQFKEILKLLRKKFPDTLIQITTNGSRLTRENIELLKEVEPVELNLSLNSASPEGRKSLMNDRRSEVVLEGIKELARMEITYHGSIVALPQIIGWHDLEETISFLEEYQAQTVRVFLPGYSRLSPENIKFDFSLWEELEDFIKECRGKYKLPITLDPTRVDSLEAEVIGVLKGSPAYHSGLEIDDRIIKVNDQEVFSRVDAFNKLIKLSNPEVEIRRNSERKLLRINKQAGEKSGLVFDYDLDPSLILEIERVANSHRADKVLLMTSQLAYQRLKKGLERLDDRFDIIATENKFFGGSILCAGLLVVDDFREKLKEFRDNLKEFDLILLPQIAFDNWGNDLCGESYYQLSEEFGVEVEIV